MKTLYKKIIILITSLSSITLFAAGAQNKVINHNNWTLENNRSYLNFSSVKNRNIIEVHKFSNLSGVITQEGIADIKINLKSVATGIDVRDERLKDYIFDTSKYPVAIFSTHVDINKILQELYKSPDYKTTLEGSLNLKGHKIPLKVPVDVKYLNHKNIQVMSSSPILLNIDDFKMGEGLNKIREFANLDSIGLNIPVNFKVLFKKND